MTTRRFHLTNEVIVTLIEAVRSRGCLWNPEDENYNDRFNVLTAWKELAKTFEMPEDVVKTKWKNLRDLFKREIRKSNPKTLQDYTGKWRHFEAMWFLHRPGDYVSNDETEDNQNDEEFDVEHMVKFEPVDRDVADYLDDPIDPSPVKKRRYNDDDYDIMYLKSLTPYFRQLEPIRKLVLRSKIQDMLMNEIAAQNSSNRLNFKNS